MFEIALVILNNKQTEQCENLTLQFSNFKLTTENKATCYQIYPSH